MFNDSFSRRLVGAAIVGLLAGAVVADDVVANSDTDSDRVARLSGALEAQQDRIALLEQQAASAEAQSQDAQRTEAMKQQIREVMSEQGFRESLMPSMVQAGYDKGFFIRSSDEKFMLKINGRMQFRWTHYATRATNRWLLPGLQRNDRTGFDIQRLRVGFTGYAYTKDLTYHIELDMGRGNNYQARPWYSWFNYRFRDEFQVMGGLFKIAATRAQMTSDGDLQFVDRPMTDAVFQFERGIGVRFWGRLFDKRLDYYLDVVNSLNGPHNRVITPDTDTPTGTEIDGNPALVFHTIWHALGNKPGEDCKAEGDLDFHESPALDIGFHYAFNEDEGDSTTTTLVYPRPGPGLFGGGGFGVIDSNGVQLNQFGLDTAFKWQGFSATGEYFVRMIDPRRAGRPPFTSWWLVTGDDSTTAQHGAYLQLGYFLPIPGLEKKLEAVARVGGISALADGREGVWEYAGGLNYYFEGHKVKLQTDVTRIYEVPITSSSGSLANVNDDALIWRVQMQVGF